jgi:hypothetical protein
MTILTKSEAQAFLTKDDLAKIERDIEKQKFAATLGSATPVVVVRGKEISFFDILELIGTL